MFGLDPLFQELREANEKYVQELAKINDTLDELNHNIKILVDIEFEKLPKKSQNLLTEKWQPNRESTD